MRVRLLLSSILLLILFSGVSSYLLFVSGSGASATTLAQSMHVWLYANDPQEFEVVSISGADRLERVEDLLYSIVDSVVAANPDLNSEKTFAGVFDSSGHLQLTNGEIFLDESAQRKVWNLLKQKKSASDALGPVFYSGQGYVGRLLNTGDTAESSDNASPSLVFLAVPDTSLRADFSASVREGGWFFSAALVILIAAHGIFLAVYLPWAARRKKRVKPVFVASVLVVAFVIQVLLVGGLIHIERDRVSDADSVMARQVAASVASYVARDIADGSFDHEPVTRIVDLFPSIHSIELYSGDDQVVRDWFGSAETSDEEPVSGVSDIQVSGLGIGRVEVLSSRSDIGLIRVLWYSGMTILISLLILGELTLLVFKWLQRYTVRKIGHPNLLHYSLIRPAMFLFLCGVDLCMSFLPLQMQLLSDGDSFLPREILSALPVSVEFAFVGIAMLTVGHVIQRFGWHIPFIGGLVVAALGALYSWIAPDMLQFVLSRAIVGIGYGSALMAAQGYVIGTTSHANQTHGFADLFAGVYAGSICGAAVGGVLADRLGYGPVFVIGSILLISTIIYAFIFLRNAFSKVRDTNVVEKKDRGGFGSLIRDPQLLSVIFFSGIPASIAVIGFVHYLCPVFLSDSGLSQTGIGYVLVVYGALLVYLGPTIGKLADRIDNPRLLLTIGNAIGALGLCSFALGDGIPVVVTAVVLLGMSSSIVLSVQGALVVDLDVTRRVGKAPTLAFFRASTRVGQFAGPLLFGFLTLLMGTRWAVCALGVAYAMAALMFWVVNTRSDKKNIEVESFV